MKIKHNFFLKKKAISRIRLVIPEEGNMAILVPLIYIDF